MFSQDITKEELNDLPLKKYEGKVALIAREDSLMHALKEIRQHDIVGFDTERKPSFTKGPSNEISLIQIAVPGKVFLIRINYTGIKKQLISIFESNKIKKVGIGLNDDIQSLKMLFDFKEKSFVDLNEVATGLGVKCNGARKLTALFLGFRISKRQQTSNWEQPILTKSQIAYAATDAWICLEIYQQLEYWGYLD